MNKFLTAIALGSALLLSSSAHARDYMDKTETNCDKDDIETELTRLFENGRAGKIGIRVVYVKDNTVEVSRKSTEVRCRITVVTNTGNVTGIFNWKSQDGHSLVGFEPGKTK
jgi:hypothetical protein